MKPTNERGCTREPLEGDCAVSELQLTAAEEAVLLIARIFFHSLTHSESQAWMAAFAEAEDIFGSDEGMIVAGRTLNLVKAIRRARRSPFMFNSPTCPGCSQIASVQERQMMTAIALMRLGDHERAHAELVALCETGDVDAAFDATKALCELLSPPLAGQVSVHPPHRVLQ
ncbi:MAG: hypothetical protein AAF739_02960 [Pseudomonadota bacterium]